MTFFMPKEKYSAEIEFVFSEFFKLYSCHFKVTMLRFPLDLYKSNLQILNVLGEPEV